MLGIQRNIKQRPIPKNYALILMCICTERGLHVNAIFTFVLFFCEGREPGLSVLRSLLENSKFIFPVSPVTCIITTHKTMLSLHTALLMFSCVLVVLQLLATGRLYKGATKRAILINGSFECGSRAVGTQQRVTKYGKNQQMLHRCS